MVWIPSLDFHQKKSKLVTPLKEDCPYQTHFPRDQNPDQSKKASSIQGRRISKREGKSFLKEKKTRRRRERTLFGYLIPWIFDEPNGMRREEAKVRKKAR